MRRAKRFLCFCAVLLLIAQLPVHALADMKLTWPFLENLPLVIDGNEAIIIKTLHYDYGNNRYVSLRDFAAALKDTPRHFGLSVSGEMVSITTDGDYFPVGGENEPFPETNASTGAAYVYSTDFLALNPMQIDGRELRYMSFLANNTAARLDCYMSLTDLAMQLDLNIEVSIAGMTLNTALGYRIDVEQLAEEGFFQEVHSALLGDASAGVILTAFEPELSVPIASTTKLMSFLLVMDALSDGEISLSDPVTITEEAAQLSRTMDGKIAMQAGAVSNVTDLLCGMMLPSSNECALALAIHVAGSEAAFVERMNKKAQILGLSDGVIFYNCHGLPIYADNLAATKIQNRMSARDMFLLASYILRTYPDVTRFTALKYATLESLNASVMNTNPLLYNLPGAVGLKTGTTNFSGSCLVGAVEAEDAEGRTHTLISVEFGAEDSTVRATLSEELLRYGMQRLREGADWDAPAATEIPTDAEELIRTVLRY